MVASNNISPTSTLTPLDIIPSSGTVEFHSSDCAINERENFKRLGSFWQRQMSPSGISHAKTLACTALKTNALANVQNVKSNLSNDRQNLYFNDIEVPILEVLPIEDLKNISSTLQDIAKGGFVWKLKSGHRIDNIRFSYVTENTEEIVSGSWENGLHFKQIGQWLVFVHEFHIPRQPQDFQVLLCSGCYFTDSYFGQSFYKPLLGLDYLPVGPGAQFVAEYISGKHQDLRSFEIVLNTLVGLEANFGRGISKVLTADANIQLRSDVQKDIQLVDTGDMNKSFMILQDKITDEVYSLSYIGPKDSNIGTGSTLPANSFGSYLIQLATKKYNNADEFFRVSAHACGTSISIDELSNLAICPRNTPSSTVKSYSNSELNSIIINNLDTALIVHLGKIDNWYNYHKYASSRSDYFKSHFKTYKDLINYVVSVVKEYAPITYTPIFTCTYDDITSDYNLFLYRENEISQN